MATNINEKAELAYPIQEQRWKARYHVSDLSAYADAEGSVDAFSVCRDDESKHVRPCVIIANGAGTKDAWRNANHIAALPVLLEFFHETVATYDLDFDLQQLADELDGLINKKWNKEKPPTKKVRVMPSDKPKVRQRIRKRTS